MMIASLLTPVALFCLGLIPPSVFGNVRGLPEGPTTSETKEKEQGRQPRSLKGGMMMSKGMRKGKGTSPVGKGTSPVGKDTSSGPCRGSSCDEDLLAQLTTAMHQLSCPTVGYAIIDGYQIVDAHTFSIYPEVDAKLKKDSLFQGASWSKPLTTTGILNLVREGKITLEGSANSYLKTWKIPNANGFDADKITVHNLLAMTSGLPGMNNLGWNRSQAHLPELQDYLDGVGWVYAPPNAPSWELPPVEPNFAAGEGYRYSNGGFATLAKIIEDQTGEAFEDYIQHAVLDKMGMKGSFFQYPIPDRYTSRVAPAANLSGSLYADGWMNMAPGTYACAGVWTTPTEYATFVLNLVGILNGTITTGPITQELAMKMTTRSPAPSSFGLGVVVNGDPKDDNYQFRKTGQNPGYQNMMMMFPNTGQGIAMMAACDGGNFLYSWFIDLIARKNNWPYYFPELNEVAAIPHIW